MKKKSYQPKKLNINLSWSFQNLSWGSSYLSLSMIILRKNFILSILLKPFYLEPTSFKYSRMESLTEVFEGYFSFELICASVCFFATWRISVKNMIRNIASEGWTLIKSGKYFRIDKLPSVKLFPTNLAVNFAKFEVFLAS